MYMRIGIRTRTFVIATLATLGATTATSLARAAEFGALQPGSTVCTDWLRSDGGGVYLVGFAMGSGTYTWTMRMATTPGGAEREIFRAVTRQITRNVVPPTTGTFFYRNCLNVSNKPAAYYRLVVSAGIGSLNPVYGIGAHTATLTPGSTACGEFAMRPALLLGSSDRPVRWSSRGTDMDYGFMGEIFSMTGATVDQVFDVRPPLFSIDACAVHTTSGTATVSFELRDF